MDVGLERSWLRRVREAMAANDKSDYLSRES